MVVVVALIVRPEDEAAIWEPFGGSVEAMSKSQSDANAVVGHTTATRTTSKTARSIAPPY
jgi:hypothetical protein